MASNETPQVEHVLRPMDMTQILNASIALLLSAPGLYVAAIVLANLPLLLWQFGALAAPSEWFVPPRYRSGQDLYSMLGTAARLINAQRIDARDTIALAVSLLSSLLQSALLTVLIAARYRGTPLPLRNALSTVQSALPRLCMTYSLSLAVMLTAAWLYAKSNVAPVIGVGLLLAAFPFGIFMTQTVMLEDAAPLTAWKRSALLLRRRLAAVVGTWAMYELIFVVIAAIPTFVMGMGSALLPPGPRLNTLTIAAGNLAILLIEPLREACATLLYFEQRRRRREVF